MRQFSRSRAELLVCIFFLCGLAIYFFRKDFSVYRQGIPALTDELVQGANYGLAQITAIDDILIVILTFIVGQSIVVGTLARSGMAKNRFIRYPQLACILTFIVVVLHVGAYIYLARMVLVHQVAYGLIDLVSLQKPIGDAAWWTSIGFFAVSTLAVLALTDSPDARRPTRTSQFRGDESCRPSGQPPFHDDP